MTVPLSGPISLGQIRQELESGNYTGGTFTSSSTSLEDTETGVYETINSNSNPKPDGSSPFAMSEWTGYTQLVNAIFEECCMSGKTYNFSVPLFYLSGWTGSTDAIYYTGGSTSCCVKYRELGGDGSDGWPFDESESNCSDCLSVTSSPTGCTVYSVILRDCCGVKPRIKGEVVVPCNQSVSVGDSVFTSISQLNRGTDVKGNCWEIESISSTYRTLDTNQYGGGIYFYFEELYTDCSGCTTVHSC